jgi:eukaryotic-like serine/threonine-protein kinase
VAALRDRALRRLREDAHEELRPQPLTTGRRLGRYEIRERLGAGGMGEVYRAFDTRLLREVAVKVVSARVGHRPDALARLEQEARAASALNHPHICTIHDIAEEGGVPYVVMELVEGETLRRRLGRRVPLESAIVWARQMALGLAAAHERGIVHRDLKPENVLVTRGGAVKIADFGLARLRSPEDAPASAVFQGTPGYLAPELARGDAADFRADQFSLGAILYEMIAGRPPFAGPTVVAILDATLRVEPPALDALRPRLPAPLAQVVARCLQKDPALRYPSAGELCDALAFPPVADRPQAPARRRLWWAAAVTAVVAAAAVAWWKQPRARPVVPARLVPLTHGEGDDDGPAFSPRGDRLMFASDRAGNWDLWTVPTEGGDPVRVTDTPEAEGQPAFSPDGSQVAFVRRRAGGYSDVFAMPAGGGAARLVAEQAMDPAWSPDGRALAISELTRGWVRIATVPVRGGARSAVTGLEEGYFHRRPAWTPDGRTLVFNRSPGGNVGQLMRVPSTGGAAVPVTRDREGVANLQATVTPDGAYVVHASDRGGALNLWRIPLGGGSPERITSGPGHDLEPRVAPDGRRIAFVSNPQVVQLVSVSIETGARRTLASFEGSEVWAPDVSPDGTAIVFAQKVPGSAWRMMVTDGRAGAPRAVLDGLPDVMWVRFLPDGASLVFEERRPQGGRIGTVGVDGTGLAWRTPEDEDARHPDVSPDGARLAWVRNESAHPEIVVRDLRGGKPLATIPGATLPRFSPDGSRLAFAGSRAYTGGVGVFDLATRRSRWLSSSGSWPTWLAGGRTIAFADVGPQGDQIARAVDADRGGPSRPLVDYSWRGLHRPFVVAPDGRHLVTTDGSEIKSTIWLAEF